MFAIMICNSEKYINTVSNSNSIEMKEKVTALSTNQSTQEFGHTLHPGEFQKQQTLHLKSFKRLHLLLASFVLHLDVLLAVLSAINRK